MLRQVFRAQVSSLGDDEVEVVMSTPALARDGHVLLPQGCDLADYRANPIVLWSHDPDFPIGNAEEIKVDAAQITARIRFAPAGISPKADEIRGLMKAGVLRAVSVGFEPVEMEPLDPKKPRGGQRITAWQLLELSAVSVPADAGALVTARAHGETMPETVKPRCRSAAPVTFTRGLYALAQLCYLFEEMGWQLDMAKYESAIEDDASKVPGMLAGVLHDLGDVILAMSAEEIAEALAGHDVEPVDDDGDIVLSGDERAHIAAATTPALRAWRRGRAQAKLRAGKVISAASAKALRAAQDLHEEAMGLHRSAIAKHKKGIDAVGALLDGADDDGDDDASDTVVQTSDGDTDDDGARAAAARRRRQVEILAFAVR